VGFIVKRKYLLTIGVVLAAIIVLNNFLHPPDWVELQLTNVPLELTNIYVVSSRHEVQAPIKWYLIKVVAGVEDARFGEMWRSSVNRDQRVGDVQWPMADRYGILGRRKSGQWVLWWLKPEDVEKPTPLRYLIGGGGTATIRASGIERAMPAPKSLTAQVKDEE
jgi:hypothetical protein